MRIRKGYNLALVFTLIGVFLWPMAVYGLRPPLTLSKTAGEFRKIINSAKAPDFVLQVGARVEIKDKQFNILEWLRTSTYRAEDLESGKSVVLKFQGKGKKCSGYERDFFAKVPSHDNIVRGYSLVDESGDILIVTEFTEGEKLQDYLSEFGVDHKRYFLESFPEILNNFMGAIRGVEHIVKNGFYNEFAIYHIWIDKKTGRYILFDFDLPSTELSKLQALKDLESSTISNIGGSLCEIVAPLGIYEYEAVHDEEMYFDELGITDADFNEYNLLVDLQKVYPYIPDELNKILLRFGRDASNPYTSISELYSDLESVVKLLKSEKPQLTLNETGGGGKNLMRKEIEAENYALSTAGLKIGMAQIDISPYEITREDSIQTIERKIKLYLNEIKMITLGIASQTTEGQKPNLIVFPEGLCHFIYIIEDKYVKKVDSIFKEELKSIAEIAREQNITIGLGGLLEKINFIRPEGCYLIIKPNGEIIENFRDEEYDPEERIFEFNGTRIGLAICYEFFDKSLIDGLKKADVDIVIVPVYSTSPLDNFSGKAKDENLKAVFVNSISSSLDRSGGSTWQLEDSGDIFLPDKERVTIVGFNKDNNSANLSQGKTEKFRIELFVSPPASLETLFSSSAKPTSL